MESVYVDSSASCRIYYPSTKALFRFYDKNPPT